MNTIHIKGILFDLDGTLIDRDSAFEKWLRHEMHSSTSPNIDIESVVKEIICEDASGYGDKQVLLEKIASLCNWPVMSTEEHFVYFQTGLLKYIHIDTRIIELLSCLQKDYALGLCSNGSSNMQRAKIKNAGLCSFFDPCLISGERNCKKPQSDIFNMCLDSWGIPAQEILMVGDHLGNDIVGAQSVGLRTAWITSDRTVSNDASNYILRSIFHIKDILHD